MLGAYFCCLLFVCLFSAMTFPDCIEVDLLDDNETEVERESFQVLLMASEGFEDLVDIENSVLEVILVDNDRGECDVAWID